MAMLPATVWTRTFSTGENGSRICLETMRNRPKPIRLAGSVIVLTLTAMSACHLWSPGCARLASLPPGLQTEVHVGEADDEPHQQTDKDTTQREAASGRDTPR